MSLLTIASRHHEFRSHNLVTFHHSKTVERQLPAPLQHEIHERHGTRVTVRNLFGNLPVRVKQRAVVVEHRVEQTRLWETLRREVTGILLSWKGQISLKVRDVDGRTSLSFGDRARTATVPKPRSSDLHSKLHVLTQACYICIDEWSTWVPVKASTSSVLIKGAISLKPAPSKRVQFISLGLRPLPAESGHNELYEEVNRIFSQSGFGLVEDDADVDANEKTRRQNDKRFKSDGHTNKQLTARKGVDRYPMFCLRILLDYDHDHNRSEDHSYQDDTNIQAVVEVLSAMLTQWLSVHHFRPRKSQAKGKRQNYRSTSASETDASDALDVELKPHQDVCQEISTSATSTSQAPTPPSQHNGKRQRLKSPDFQRMSRQVQLRPFAEWSRIKSGKPDFFDTLSTRRKPQTAYSLIRPTSNAVPSTSSNARAQSSGGVALFDVKALLPGVLSNSGDSQQFPAEEGSVNKEDADETITWTDPLTKTTSVLNARTGCVLAHPPVRHASSADKIQGQGTLDRFDRPWRGAKKIDLPKKSSTPWLNGLLKAWDNPVFNLAEKGVQQVCHHEHQLDNQDPNRSPRIEPSSIQIDRAFNGSSAPGVSRLSKTALGDAETLAQLDNKFILVKMRNSGDVRSDVGFTNQTLVLIDQHAADERVQVETLLADLCAPLPKDDIHSAYRSNLGHRSHVRFTILEKALHFTISHPELTHFEAHAARFAAWGILFNVTLSSTSSTRKQPVISVTALPPAISERCRVDPQTLITFLRSAVWKYADTARRAASLADQTSASPKDEESASWVRQISTCPHGLIDLINSRACRSAIMFNDELTVDECKELVRKLSRCVFPFMCAHGRPSMVPLLDLGAQGGEGDVSFGASSERMSSARGGFVSAWKKWSRG